MENKFGKRQWKKEEKRFKTLDEYLSYQEQTVGKAKEITDEERKSLKGKRKVTGFEVTEDSRRKSKKDKDGRQDKKRFGDKKEKNNEKRYAQEQPKEKNQRKDKDAKKETKKDQRKDSFQDKKENKAENKAAKKDNRKEIKKDSLKETKKGTFKQERKEQRKDNKKEKKSGRKFSDDKAEMKKKIPEAAATEQEMPAEAIYEEDYAASENENIPADTELQDGFAEDYADNPNRIEGRNAVTEAFRSGRDVDKIFIQKDLHDGAISTITRMAKKSGTIMNFVTKERLNQMSQTGAHQGVIAYVAAYHYATLEDILKKAEEKDEAPFIFLLDGIEDPHNLGAIIRTANLCGAHGVIITKHRAAGLTATVAKASAGALNYTPVAKVTNLGNTIDQLKKDGMWFVCADMGGTNMYQLELKGSIGLIIGNEGDGVSRLIKEKCDFIASIPMKGDIDSLNASVAAGVLGFEISRQRG